MVKTACRRRRVRRRAWSTATTTRAVASRRRYSRSGAAWTLDRHEKYLYDGFKVVAVYDDLNNDEKLLSVVWSPPGSGSDAPALIEHNNNVYFCVVDGNKNVRQLVDGSGAVAAEYDYDPFGRVVSATGPMADLNPIRFSGEYHDDETGLVYYNFRYYHPGLGRWLSRDPIEEDGGVNLYGMVGNDPVNYWDILGWGRFFVWQTQSKGPQGNFADPKEMSHMEMQADPDGFMVNYFPFKADYEKCPKRTHTIYLSRSISNDGPSSKDPHVDASKAEKDANQAAGGTLPPPRAKPKGNTDYSFWDSPGGATQRSDISTFTIEVVAVCQCNADKNNWKIIDSVLFTFSNLNRTVHGPPKSKTSPKYPGAFMANGSYPGDHWNSAWNSWQTP